MQRCEMPLTDLITYCDYLSGDFAAEASLVNRVEAHLEDGQCRNCQERIRRLAKIESLGSDLFASVDMDDKLLGQVVSELPRRSQRLIPLRANSDQALTEAELHALVRSGATDADAVVTRVSFLGDLKTLGAPIHVVARIAVRFGVPLQSAARRVRRALAHTLAEATDFWVQAIDVEVIDVLPPDAAKME